MDITWDPQKAAENLRSHDVAFADAATVLDDPCAITIADPEHDEQRFITLRVDLTGRLLVVVYAYAGAEEIRIILPGKPVEARDDAMQTNPADGMREEYDFSQGKRGAVVPHQGKTRITLWVDIEVLDWFRALAEREGRGYQTAMNAALRQYTQQAERPLHELVRDVIREELQKLPDLVKEMWQATPGDMNTTTVPEIARRDRVPSK